MKLWHFPGARANDNIKRILKRLPHIILYIMLLALMIHETTQAKM